MDLWKICKTSKNLLTKIPPRYGIRIRPFFSFGVEYAFNWLSPELDWGPLFALKKISPDLELIYAWGIYKLKKGRYYASYPMYRRYDEQLTVGLISEETAVQLDKEDFSMYNDTRISFIYDNKTTYEQNLNDLQQLLIIKNT